MWPVLVVVAAVDAEYVFEVAAAEDQNPVEAVGADGTYPAFGVGVCVRRPHRRPDHLHSFGAEDFVEGVTELRVAIMDEEPKLLLLAELHDQIAGLLDDPAAVRVCGAGDVLDTPVRERDEEEHVDPLQ